MSESRLWTKILIVICITYALGLGLRVAEIPAWNAPSLHVNGEPLMATHDAYAWMAGAQGTGRLTDRPMSNILAWMHAVTGMKIGVINFWLPALLSPLVVIPLCLLAGLWGRPQAGLMAGVMGAGSLGFLLRTRVGFGDTDVLTLFLPLFLATALVWWLTPLTRAGWRGQPAGGEHASRGAAEAGPEAGSAARFNYMRAAATGIVFAVYTWFYPNGYPVAMYTVIIVLLAAWWLRRERNAQHFLLQAAMILALGKLGWTGAGLAAAFAGLGLYRREWAARYKLGLAGVVLVLVLFPVLCGWGTVDKLIEPVLSYAKLSPSATTESNLNLPTVKQSIREAQDIPWMAIMTRLAGHWALFAAAIAGVAVLVWVRPLAVVLLPMLGLALLSFKLGNRFAMYGGPALGLGLGYALVLFWERLPLRPSLQWAASLTLAGVAFLPLARTASQFSPAPILPKPYAATFMDLKDEIPKQSRLWQWWDYGYAAQYYAGRRTFGDGGAHSGPWLYPLAVVHATDSCATAARVMRLVGADMGQQRVECEHNGTGPQNPGAKLLYYPMNPIRSLEEMGPEKAQEFVHHGPDPLQMSAPKFPQYLVLSWENLRLAYWITTFGHWDLTSGRGRSGRIQKLQGRIRIRPDKGELQGGGRRIELNTLDVLTPGGRKHSAWPNGTGIHAVLNQLSREVYIMDDAMYASMLVRMLLGDPQNFRRYFVLVQDRFPWNRVYKLRGSG